MATAGNVLRRLYRTRLHLFGSVCLLANRVQNVVGRRPISLSAGDRFYQHNLVGDREN